MRKHPRDERLEKVVRPVDDDEVGWRRTCQETADQPQIIEGLLEGCSPEEIRARHDMSKTE